MLSYIKIKRNENSFFILQKAGGLPFVALAKKGA
jgi:hypothetical protein